MEKRKQPDAKPVISQGFIPVTPGGTVQVPDAEIVDLSKLDPKRMGLENIIPEIIEEVIENSDPMIKDTNSKDI